MALISTTICGAAFHVLTDDAGVVTYATFGEPPATSSATDPSHPVADLLRRYARGDLRALDGINVRQPGSEFRQATWAALRGIAPGATISYAELAALAGRPAAVRAAASGCATNQIPLIVPCHRVIRSGGQLGGYAFGLDLKRRLLAHEQRSA